MQDGSVAWGQTRQQRWVTLMQPVILGGASQARRNRGRRRESLAAPSRLTGREGQRRGRDRPLPSPQHSFVVYRERRWVDKGTGGGAGAGRVREGVRRTEGAKECGGVAGGLTREQASKQRRAKGEGRGSKASATVKQGYRGRTGRPPSSGAGSSDKGGDGGQRSGHTQASINLCGRWRQRETDRRWFGWQHTA